MLSLFDDSGNLVIFVDDGAEPEINADPATGLALDSYFSVPLVPGAYTLALSQSNNYPGATIADPYSRQNEGSFTFTYGCGPGQFYDFACNARNEFYVVEILDVTGDLPVPPPVCSSSEELCEASPVPIPPALWVFFSGIAVLVGSVRRTKQDLGLPGRPRDRAASFTALGVVAGLVALTPETSFALEELTCGFEVNDAEEPKALDIWAGTSASYLAPPIYPVTYQEAFSFSSKSLGDELERLKASGRYRYCSGIIDLGLDCQENGPLSCRRDSEPSGPARLYSQFACGHYLYGYCDNDPVPVAVSARYYKLQKCPVASLTKVDSADSNTPGYDPGRTGLIQQHHATDAAAGALTSSLENGSSAKSLLGDGMKKAEACMAAKFAALGIPYKITATVRTKAYQEHFKELWNKREALLPAITNNFENQIRCADLKGALDGEFGFDIRQDTATACAAPQSYNRNHCIRYGPAQLRSNHQSGNAIDIDSKTVARLRNKLKIGIPNMNIPPSTSVNEFLNQLLDDQFVACSGDIPLLQWGGNFTRPDDVHFQLQP